MRPSMMWPRPRGDCWRRLRPASRLGIARSRRRGRRLGRRSGSGRGGARSPWRRATASACGLIKRDRLVRLGGQVFEGALQEEIAGSQLVEPRKLGIDVERLVDRLKHDLVTNTADPHSVPGNRDFLVKRTARLRPCMKIFAVGDLGPALI